MVGASSKSEVVVNGRMRQLARMCGGSVRIGFYLLSMHQPAILAAVLDAEPPTIGVKKEDIKNEDHLVVDIGK